MTTTTATMMMMKRVALSRADGSVQVGCWGSGWAARVACNGREGACGGRTCGRVVVLEKWVKAKEGTAEEQQTGKTGQAGKERGTEGPSAHD
jgi:hypothetical protein